jgi:hypothetical protein
MRAVSLAVIGTNAALEVTPATDLNASGFTGGPFTPGSALYTLINSGDAVTAWAASKSQPWVTLSSTNGALSPGASVAISVSINTNASGLPAGAYTNTLDFLNLTTGNGNTTHLVTLQVNQRPGILAVAPLAGFNVAGITGENFAPTSMVYTLANSGLGPLAWTVSVSQPWVDAFPTNGLLAPGETAQVTVSLNSGI